MASPLLSRTMTKSKDRSAKRYSADQVRGAFELGMADDIPDDMTVKELSRQISADKETTKTYLETYQELLPNLFIEGRIDWFTRNRANIYKAIEDCAAESLMCKIRAGELSGKELTTAIKTLHSIGRLEEGKSTQNLSQQVAITNNSNSSIESILIDTPPPEIEES